MKNKLAVIAVTALSLAPFALGSMAYAQAEADPDGGYEVESGVQDGAHDEPLISVGEPVESGHHIGSAEAQEHATIHGHSDTDPDHGEDVHGAEHAAHGEVDGLPQFDPSTYPSQIFWLALVFILLYIFFSRKTLPDISKVLDTRQAHVQNDLDNAENLKDEAEKVRSAYEAILEEARHKSSESFMSVESDIKSKADKSSKDFMKRAADQMESTEKAVASAKTAVMAEIDNVAAKVAAEAAERIIGVKVDEKYAQSVVQSLQGNKKAA